jgi:hypothetical protein
MNTNQGLKLVLFENDPVHALKSVACGIHSFMIDLEIMGKDLRQLGFDTEIRPSCQENLTEIAQLPNVGIRPAIPS